MQFASLFDGKKFMKIMSLVLSAVMLTVSIQAEAKRLGGGRSFGKQSGSVTQRESARPAGQNAATAPAATPSPAVQQPRRPWGAMLGGLAAGLDSTIFVGINSVTPTICNLFKFFWCRNIWS